MTNIANKLQAEKLYSIDSICWALDLVVNRQNLKATRAQLRWILLAEESLTHTTAGQRRFR